VLPFLVFCHSLQTPLTTPRIDIVFSTQVVFWKETLSRRSKYKPKKDSDTTTQPTKMPCFTYDEERQFKEEQERASSASLIQQQQQDVPLATHQSILASVVNEAILQPQNVPDVPITYHPMLEQTIVEPTYNERATVVFDYLYIGSWTRSTAEELGTAESWSTAEELGTAECLCYSCERRRLNHAIVRLDNLASKLDDKRTLMYQISEYDYSELYSTDIPKKWIGCYLHEVTKEDLDRSVFFEPDPVKAKKDKQKKKIQAAAVANRHVVVVQKTPKTFDRSQKWKLF
jgi:hypothetical protein